MEAGGIEPPSEKFPLETSTGLCQVSTLIVRAAPDRASHNQLTLSLAFVTLSRFKRQPDGFCPSHMRIRCQPVQRRSLIKLRRRIRNRCQLLGCRFLRGQRRLGLQFRLPRPRRNQCAPRIWLPPRPSGVKEIRHFTQKARDKFPAESVSRGQRRCAFP